MTARRATDRERRKYGKEWIIRRSKPIIPSKPPAAPWSHESVFAYDAAALGRDLPPMEAMHLRRIERRALRGFFDLRVPHWHLTLHSCCWFVKPRREWIGLPKRQWTDQNGRTYYEPVITLDEVYAARFEECALEALHLLLARAAKSGSDNDEPPRINGHALHVDGELDHGDEPEWAG